MDRRAHDACSATLIVEQTLPAVVGYAEIMTLAAWRAATEGGARD